MRGARYYHSTAQHSKRRGKDCLPCRGHSQGCGRKDKCRSARREGRLVLRRFLSALLAKGLLIAHGTQLACAGARRRSCCFAASTSLTSAIGPRSSSRPSTRRAPLTSSSSVVQSCSKADRVEARCTSPSFAVRVRMASMDPQAMRLRGCIARVLRSSRDHHACGDSLRYV